MFGAHIGVMTSVLEAYANAGPYNAARADSISQLCKLYGLNLEESTARYEQERAEREKQRIHDALMARIRDKDQNMSTRLERRREAIWRKWALRGVAMVVAPLAIALVAGCWRLAVMAVFE